MASAGKRPLKVFLCHASGDKPPVRDLYKRLVAEGVDAWLDKERLLPGQDWRLEIPRAVKDADVVVVCLSNKSVTKEGYVQKEIKFALDSAEEKPEGTIFLIPARLEECTVPERLSRWQWVDLYEENGFIQLLRSLKLRADAVGAAVEPTAYEDSDKEVEQRVDQLYTEGLAAFYTEDWDKACHRFQTILSERPNHKNAAEKLAESERQRNLAKLYAQSMEGYKSENWTAAIKTLEELFQKSAEYKDAAQLLRNARKQKQLRELYAEAGKLHAAQKWQAVVKVFEQISGIDPGFPDTGGLLSSAQTEVAELKRLAGLNDLYSHAVREMDAGQWVEARRLLEQVHKAQTGFLETEHLLKKIEGEISNIEERNRRNNQINTLYEQAHELPRTNKWQNALEKIQALRTSLPQAFKDLKPIRVIIVLGAILLIVLVVIPSMRIIYERASGQLINATASAVSDIQSSPSIVPTILPSTNENTIEQQDQQSEAWIDGSALVDVPQGEFIIGDNSGDNSEHIVELNKFWIYRTKVTNIMYANCVAADVCKPPPLGDYDSPFHASEPVVNVTWEQADTYCAWLQARLPTEAEWEKTARGPYGNIYPWGETAPDCDLLNFNNCIGIPSFVTDFSSGKSYYGAYDMAGNVFEWMADWYAANYYESFILGNPAVSQKGEYRSVRGSGFLSGPQDVRLANRFFLSPEESRADLGFRCVVDNPKIFSPNCDTSASVREGLSDPALLECAQPYAEIVGNFCINGNKYVNIDIPDNNDGYRIVSVAGEHEIDDLACSESKGNANDISEIRVTCNWRSEETSVNVCRLCQVSVAAEDYLCYEGYEFDPKTNLCKVVGQRLNPSCPQGFASNTELGCCVSPLREDFGTIKVRNCYSNKIPEQTFSCAEIRPTKSGHGQQAASCNYSCSDIFERSKCEEAGGTCTTFPGPCILPPQCP